MSDEPPPPPLRLKARLRPDGEPAVPSAENPVNPSVAPSGSNEAASETPPPKLRLKPRLESATSATETPVSATPPPALQQDAAPAAPFRLKPKISSEVKVQEDAPAIAAPSAVEPAPSFPTPAVVLPSPVVEPTPPQPEPPKFKFKPKVPESAATAAVESDPSLSQVPAPPPTLPATSASAPSPSPRPQTPPPFPVLAEPPVPTKKFPPPPGVPHVKAPKDLAETEIAALPAQPAAKRSLKKFLLPLAAIVILGAALVGYRFLTVTPDPAPVPVVKKAPSPNPAPTAKAAPTPSDTLNQIAAMPAKAIESAQNVVAARRTNEQDRVDALVAGEDAPTARALNTPPPGTFVAPAKTASVAPAVKSTSQLSPGITVTTTSAEIAGDASPAFRSWVAQLKISGVFQGNPPRAIINSRTYRAGQIVDDALGITFDGINAEAKSIVFRDRAGATVTRRY